MKGFLSDKSAILFTVLAGFFVINALLAEFIGVKIFAFEETLGLPPLNLQLFGESYSLMLTAGVLVWPVVFVMTDIINEYYGKRNVRFLSYLTAALIAYGFFIVYISIELTPPDWWVKRYVDMGVPDMQAAYAEVFGQGLWITVGSMTAFLFGQILDVAIFHRLRLLTGDRLLWLRATGSTLVSQLVDTFVVLYIAFVLGPQKWGMELFIAVGTVNYIYKFVVAIVLTPVIYLAHHVIDRYLGPELSLRMRMEARGETEAGS